VHEDVDPAQQRLEVAAGDVDEAHVDAVEVPPRRAHVEPDDAVVGNETRDESVADESGDARNGNRGHVHRLTIVVHPSQGPDEPDDESEGPTPGFPFAGFPGALPIPGFGEGGLDLSALMGMLSSAGPVNWEMARQVARPVALENAPEQPLDPAAPAEFGELARAAQTHVADVAPIAASLDTHVRVVGAAEWADIHLDALRPVLEALATTLGHGFQRQVQEGIDRGELAANDPMTGMLPMLTPLLLGLQAGSMVGYLAQHALGRYDLPLPTSDQPTLVFVARHVDDFEASWSLARADLRFYLAVHEVVHAAVRSVSWARERLVRLATDYVRAYELDVGALEAKFGELDPTDPSSFEALAADPRDLLGAIRSPGQDALQERLRTFTMVVEGYTDVVLEHVAQRLIPSYGQIHEAMQRHRIERGQAGEFIEALLGIDLGRDDYARGVDFCRGVIERAGLDGLNRLWTDESMVPTPSELAAPGLWLARIDLPGLMDDE
jgi:putative hydrolase